MNRIILFTSMGLFALSLTQQSYCTSTGCGGSSIAILISGTIGFLYGGAALTWLANPLLIASWVSINRNLRLSLLTSSASTIIAFSFLLFTEVINDEAGHYSLILSYKIGYWLWVTSSLTMLIGNAALYINAKRTS